jgi:hypothetical protein
LDPIVSHLLGNLNSSSWSLFNLAPQIASIHHWSCSWLYYLCKLCWRWFLIEHQTTKLKSVGSIE